MTSRIRILLIDDSEYDVELTTAVLKNIKGKSSDIAVALDGEEALDYLYRQGKFKNRPDADPDLILLDLKMPKIDGLEVLKIIKNDALYGTIPVVILTSSKESRDIADSYALGANAYVVKPVDSFQFTDTIKKLGNFWLLINTMPD